MKAFNIEFYTGSKDELIAEIIEASTGQYGYIVTPNVNHVVQLEHSAPLRNAYSSASHRICDSRVLLPFVRAFKVPLPEAIPGSTLTAELIEHADAEQWDVCIIGCEPASVARLKERYPGLRVHHYYPPMGFITDPDAVQTCVNFINQHPSRLIVYAVGCPTQEILALKVLEGGQATGVGLCVGGSLNFLSGAVPRAPAWVQHLALEWLHRVCTEPRRLGSRYARDAWRFLPIVMRHYRNTPNCLEGAKQ
ncbi:polymer biosynthesis protein, WecB/TagA/CpsF family [Halopseudomonas xinjiangensis]|uniref:Polymer biosynthesis protein, WecB/TagA/CpsF family n=1 Tax=Halopseudomonas xinjiangensis TaxID=487184 RepID=A0A1H1WED2_9GAMM|nr:WecB/TagA/CpsF family glycosyltransferase [Halopseudomonas xinjiangensis]SDS95493.1 polymer biosynthesis protein, WecB/TagA/CpsF family [Halopseudomonas xinjiangensis]